MLPHTYIVRARHDSLSGQVNQARKELQKKFGGVREVTMPMILRRARVDVDPTTASRALKKIGVEWRVPREKACRTPEQDAARKEWCGRKRRLPLSYWQNTVDLIMDCKKFDLPLNVQTREHAARRRLRGGYRTREEGLQAGRVSASIKKRHKPFQSFLVYSPIHIMHAPSG